MTRIYLAVMRRVLQWRWGAEEAKPRLAALEEMLRVLKGQGR